MFADKRGFSTDKRGKFADTVLIFADKRGFSADTSPTFVNKPKLSADEVREAVTNKWKNLRRVARGLAKIEKILSLVGFDGEIHLYYN